MKNVVGEKKAVSGMRILANKQTNKKEERENAFKVRPRINKRKFLLNFVTFMVGVRVCLCVCVKEGDQRESAGWKYSSLRKCIFSTQKKNFF